MSKLKKNQTSQSLKPNTFWEDFKKIHWGKLKGKDAEIFPLYLKVLFTTLVLTGILFGFERLVAYLLGVLNA